MMYYFAKAVFRAHIYKGDKNSLKPVQPVRLGNLYFPKKNYLKKEEKLWMFLRRNVSRLEIEKHIPSIQDYLTEEGQYLKPL